jgi:hypothetical protein
MLKNKNSALLVLFLMSFSYCFSNTEIEFKNQFYKFKIDSKTGSLNYFGTNNTNFVYTPECTNALFVFRLRDQKNEGKYYDISATDARNISVNKQDEQILISYSSFPNDKIKVIVSIKLQKNSPLTYWNIEIDNQTDYSIDHIDFPNVVVPNNLKATGGSGTIFTPMQEGCLIEDMRIKENSLWMQYKPLDYPNLVGWGKLYPSSTQMQYMAYYNSNGGIYFAAHDENSHPKGIDFHSVSDKAIKLDFRLFAGGAGKGVYKLPFNMVLGTFTGDWYDASDIYRNWKETSKIPMPPKIKDNKSLPDWYMESPVVVTYPVRGHKDLGDMTPNELFPYTNALPIIEKYNKSFNSKIMALLMHWEGSAPWSPPYAWPPYGGEKLYDEFRDGLHEKGNLVALYASGIGYTLRSNTDTTFNMYDEYKIKNLEKVMKVAPDGKLSVENVCAGPNAQRLGYDMCPSNSFVKDVVVDQISKMVNAKTDYIQYFDQNLGGACYPCYGTNHGHAYGPGLWMKEAMTDIYRAIQPIVENAPNKPLIGCETAAGEGFQPFLQFNDARATINLFVGKPVPAYAYVNHEYVNNFMGNQNGVSIAIDTEKNPYNFLQRLSHAFCAGDMLTVILRGNGDMIWDWGTTWETPVPNQEQIIKLVNNLNGWRKGLGKEFLLTGRMLKPYTFVGAKNIPMITKPAGFPINFESIFSSNWQSGNNKALKAQFFVNYLPNTQKIIVNFGNAKNVKLYINQIKTNLLITKNGKAEITIPALNAVMVSYN